MSAQTTQLAPEPGLTPKGFAIHTPASAPEQAGALLSHLHQKLGVIPNLYAVLAESPAVLSSVLALSEQISRSSLLSATEKQVIQLAASFANGCVYCMAGHSASALRQGVNAAHVAALRSGAQLAEPRLDALRLLTSQMVEQRGQLDAEQEAAFYAAGFNRAQLLEVLLNVALKTITNYADHLAETPLDSHFAEHAWQKP